METTTRSPRHAALRPLIILAYMTTRPELQGEDPIQLFRDWLSLAETSEPNDPNAAALATCSSSCKPSVRMVLVKSIDDLGFTFYTNADSQKGRELTENPQAALCLHWKSLRRQVRVTGSISELPPAMTDSYFHSRSRRSQVGAAVSLQSRPLPSRQTLEEQVAAFARGHTTDEVPRPSFWRGYVLQPESVEFWIDGADRLHDRLLFTHAGDQWTTTLLYP